MSAAALRYAARRTVGVGGRALQRTRAAVEEEQRRRFIHSGTPLSKGENEALKNATEWQVEQMKEELFTAMTEQKQHNSEYAHYRLLEHLSEQIEPRPNDPRWRSYHRRKNISDCLRFVGMYFIASKVMEHCVGY